ncbi:MAG: AmmeMemoRadiSam system protein B [Candidatus Omnitrophica bacterium]|nr:AmmeMemoRadiSam system protein B [Candidatus Omnitrophota bacterium]
MKPLIILTAALFLASSAFASDVKTADLAGSWYPKDKAELTALLQSYLDSADPEKVDGEPFAIISPHAGYQFSGPVAAYGYKAVQGKGIKTVIIIGFSHRKRLNGISVYARGTWRTPLGDIPIDEELANELISKNRRISFEPRLFQEENSVEMQVPFIQLALGGVRIVPVAFGTQEYSDTEILAEALASVLKDRRDYLIVASTDLSHYHSYEEANVRDKRLITMLGKMRPKDLYDRAAMGACELCGSMPVVATLAAARKLGFEDLKVLKYANSGDTSGEKSKVVGYLSAVVYKEKSKVKEDSGEKPMLNETQRARLLQIARESLTGYVTDGKRKAFSEKDPLLNENVGAFVTLHEKGELRGCIGNMIGHGPLYKTVANMAIEAAAGDPRFTPLSAKEVDKVDVEISVLTPLKKVSSYNDVKIPGNGVMIRSGSRTGVFLPQVATETGWNRDEFLTCLCTHKAGLPPDAWKDPNTEIYIFSAEVFGEKGGNK